ncbi:MAG: hypothetical protein P8076_05305 [Gammaproteobacteria bacterium]
MSPSNQPVARHPSRTRVWLLTGLCALWLAACGNQDGATQVPAAVDACSLLSADDLQALAPGLSAGTPGKAKIPNTSTCEWDDASHLPALMLQVTPAPASSVKKDLESGFANMGYDVHEVTGLGDEAAVAVQRADPTHGVQAGVAMLGVRVGKRELALSPVRLQIASTSDPAFKHLRDAAALAVSRLRKKNK